MHRLLLVLLLFLPGSVEAGSPYIIKLGSKAAWPPYHLETRRGADGIAVRALACVMARLNQPYIIDKLPWKRAQSQTEIGALDGFFIASQNNERDSYAVLSALFVPQVRSFYILKSGIEGDSRQYTLDHIKQNLNVGARHGSNALYSLREAGYKVSATHATEDGLLRMLDNKRMGALLENTLVFPMLLKRTHRSMDEFHVVEMTRKNMGVYFGKIFLKKRPNFLRRFNQNIKPCSLLKRLS